jgi:acyl phosphate:glycerol-3-phosphate acyltransferase
MKELPLYLVLIVIGYLLGSIPTGQIAGALAGGVDLRRYGSGKTGATNVLRTLGWGPALAVAAGDLAKGIAAVLLARWLVPAAGGSTGFLPDPNARHIAEVLAGFAAVIGHNWSIFLQLKGGRGVLVSHAVFILICWPAALITTVAGAIVLAVSRIVSLASLTGTVVGVVALAIFVVLFHYPLPYLVYGILAAALIWLRHIDNIQRLLAGTERRLGQKAQPLP